MADATELPAPSNGDSDIISIKNLQLPFGIVARNVWGLAKEQPAQVSITLGLSAGLSSAASKDGLDENTVHYGELSKLIRSSCQKEQTLDRLSSDIAKSVQQMGMRADGTTRLSWSVVRLTLPKASMYGTAVELTSVSDYDKKGQATVSERIFGIREIKLMTLIGVNDYERTARQPLVADLDLFLEGGPEDNTGTYPAALFDIEGKLGKIIIPTAFETLETLVTFAVDKLKAEITNQALPCMQVKLRLEKPRAIAWADAPGVEVLRSIPRGDKQASQEVSASQSHRGEGMHGLTVVKPYLSSKST